MKKKSKDQHDNDTITHEELVDNGFECYKGREIDIYYSPRKCVNAANCFKRSPKVFEIGNIPWIHPQKGSKEEIVDAIQTCPSGALKYLCRKKRTKKEPRLKRQYD